MRNDLKISVVIPLYQKAAHIERCLNSVRASLDAAANRYEIIVVDDGSTDNSCQIALNWLKNKLPGGSWKFHSGPNRGAAAARNTGWKMASNEIVMFIDADDEWSSGHVFAITSLVYAHPSASLYGTGWDVINSDGARISEAFGVGARSRGEVPSFFLAMATGPMLITSSSSATWRSCLRETGGFPEGITHGEDKVAWCRLAALGGVAFDPKVTVTWRKDAQNRSDPKSPQPSDAFLRAIEETLTRGRRADAGNMHVCANVEAARLAGFISIYDDETPAAVSKMSAAKSKEVLRIRSKAQRSPLPRG
jgi:glycosyltransferase involved in cell wall biosynthesis